MLDRVITALYLIRQENLVYNEANLLHKFRKNKVRLIVLKVGTAILLGLSMSIKQKSRLIS